MRIDLHRISVRTLEHMVAAGVLPVERLIEVAPSTEGMDFWGLTVDDLAVVTKGQTPEVLQEWFDAARGDAGLYVARLNGWREWLKAFGEILGKMVVPQTAVGAYAAKGLPEYTTEESMLLFCREYFALPDFGAAGAVTLGDYYLARKGDFGHRMAEYRAGEWQRRQATKARKGRRA